MPKEENFSYGDQMVTYSVNRYSLRTSIIVCTIINEGMNERVKSVCILQSNFCPATRYVVLKPTEVTPSMA